MPTQIEVLLIGRDPVMRVYTDEVLKRAGFQVCAITPWEAKNLVNDGGCLFPLVVFSNTLYPQDVSEIGTQLRRRSPGSKLLLMLGPDPMPVDLSMFDATLEGLDGPAALIRVVRRLAAPSTTNKALNGSSNGTSNGSIAQST